MGLDEQPYFNRAQALGFFDQHHAAFEQAAQSWYRCHSDDNFSLNRWEDGRFYWNMVGLACKKGACRVRTGDGHETASIPFPAAARRAGVKPHVLRHWMETAQTLKLDGISTIGTALPVPQQYLEIKLRGSSRTPYGFLYIPAGHDAALRLLTQHGGAANIGFTFVQPINAHWAYFEARS